MGADFFLHMHRGGSKFFCACQGEDQNSFAHAKGETRKNWRLAITDRQPPSRLKNYSSLNLFQGLQVAKTLKAHRLRDK